MEALEERTDDTPVDGRDEEAPGPEDAVELKTGVVARAEAELDEVNTAGAALEGLMPEDRTLELARIVVELELAS